MAEDPRRAVRRAQRWDLEVSGKARSLALTGPGSAGSWGPGRVPFNGILKGIYNRVLYSGPKQLPMLFGRFLIMIVV